MASIREHVETVFAALAFAERNLPEEAQALTAQLSRPRAEADANAKRADARPRVRV